MFFTSQTLAHVCVCITMLMSTYLVFIKFQCRVLPDTHALLTLDQAMHHKQEILSYFMISRERIISQLKKKNQFQFFRNQVMVPTTSMAHHLCLLLMQINYFPMNINDLEKLMLIKHHSTSLNIIYSWNKTQRQACHQQFHPSKIPFHLHSFTWISNLQIRTSTISTGRSYVNTAKCSTVVVHMVKHRLYHGDHWYHSKQKQNTLPSKIQETTGCESTTYLEHLRQNSRLRQQYRT